MKGLIMEKWHYRHGEEYKGNAKIRVIKPDAAEIMVRRTCDRCGGVGGAEQWKHTGWTCFKCGGAGHLGMEAVKLYTAEKVAKLDRAAEKRRATNEAKREAREEAEALERAAKLIETKKTNAEAFPEAVKILNRDDLEPGFLSDVAAKHEEGFALTPNQAKAVRKAFGRMIARRHRNRFIDEFEKRDGIVPTGRHEVQAALIAIKECEDRFSYREGAVVHKALFVTSEGWKCFGSIPGGYAGKRGDVYRFRATFEPSKDDAGFGFYKRPYLID
jgi:hypothetical protein